MAQETKFEDAVGTAAAHISAHEALVAAYAQNIDAMATAFAALPPAERKRASDLIPAMAGYIRRQRVLESAMRRLADVIGGK